MSAQGKPAAANAVKTELPSGESILDKFIEVTGGKESYKKMKNVIFKGSVSFPAMSVSGDFTMYRAEPNLMLTEINIPSIGKMLEGFDGVRGWRYSAVQGPAVKAGAEGDEAKGDSYFRDEEWRAKYSKTETVALETVEGEECYKVVITPKLGSPKTNFYSKKTGLMIRSDAKIVTEMGEFEAKTVHKDYKKVGDIIMPFQQLNIGPMGTVTITFSEIKLNVDIPNSTFEPPAEVKALLNK
jgi:hypothetical protein